MFFILSKTAGVLVSPYYLALLLFGLALFLRLLRRAPRLRRGLGIFAGLWLLIFACGPVANVLLHPLEERHQRPERLERPPAAIVMLGGTTDSDWKGPSYYELMSTADRFVEALRLANAHPRARLLISGGSSALIRDAHREADVLARLARELGLPARRLLVDRESRNTRENAVESKRLLEAAGLRGRGPVLLVTSALHMPRSVACFRKVGVEVEPWPVDFVRSGSGPGAWLPKPQTLLRSATALNEYLGLLAYRLMGYI